MTWWRLVAENDRIPSIWTPRPSPFPHLSWRVSHPWTMMTLPRRHPVPFAHLPNSGQNLSSLFCSRAGCVEGLGEHWTGRVIGFLDLLWPLAGHCPSLRTKATRQISCALLLAQHTVSSWVWVPYSLQTAPLLGKNRSTSSEGCHTHEDHVTAWPSCIKSCYPRLHWFHGNNTPVLSHAQSCFISNGKRS